MHPARGADAAPTQGLALDEPTCGLVGVEDWVGSAVSEFAGEPPAEPFFRFGTGEGVGVYDGEQFPEQGPPGLVLSLVDAGLSGVVGP